MININNQKPLKDLPKSNRFFLISYLVLLVATLGGFVSAALGNEATGLIWTAVVVVALITNVTLAFLRF